MKRIADFVGRELTWVQPSAMRMHYELRHGDEVVGTLRFRSAFGSFATGESGDGSWTFKRTGFWQTRATVRALDSDVDIASFKNNTWSGGGTLTLAGAQELRANTNFWQNEFEFQNAAGAALIRFKTRGVIHLSVSLEIQRVAAEMPELPWLVMLGCYLIIMMQSDASAAT